MLLLAIGMLVMSSHSSSYEEDMDMGMDMDSGV